MSTFDIREWKKKQLLKESVTPPDKEKLALINVYYDAYSAADYYENEGERKGINPNPYKRKTKHAYDKLSSKYGKKFADEVVKFAEDEYEKATYGHGPGGGSFLKKYGIKPVDLDLD